LKRTQIIFFCECARWIWNLLERHFPQAVQIVDWFHAEDAFAKDKAKTWLDETLTELWYGNTPLCDQGLRKTGQPICFRIRSLDLFPQ
jgi:hypothetical protein